MKKIIAIVLLFTNLLVVAQEDKYYENGIDLSYWVHTGQNIIQENDSTFSITSSTTNEGLSWISQFLRVNTKGDTLSSVTYLPAAPYTSFKIFDIVTTSYGYAITGSIEDAPNFNTHPNYAYVLSTDFEGNIINIANVGLEDYSTRFYNIVREEATGNLLLSGYRVVEGTSKLYMVKTDELGNIIWQRTDFGYDNYRSLFGDIVQKGDEYYLSGMVNGFSSINQTVGNIFLLKIDTDGNTLWQTELNFGSMDYVNEFLITLDNEFLCSGKLNDELAVFKLDTLGNIIWQNTTSYLDGSVGTALELEDENFVLTGSTPQNESWEKHQLPIMKFSNDGEVLWKRFYGLPIGNDYGYDMIFMDGDTTGKSGYVITGRKENADNALIYLVRANCMGLVTELPNAEFTLTQPQTENPLFIQLENTSQYVYPDSIDGGSYTWTFDDGQKLTIPSEAPIEHTYENDGVYTVTLTAIVCNDTSRLSKTLCINANPLPSNITYTRAEANPNTLHFHADHPNAPDSVLWQLSNGTSSTDWSLPQTFNPDSVGSTITVTLTTYICEDTLTTSQTIDLWAVGIEEKEMDYFIGELHPNPAQTQVSLSYELEAGAAAMFELYDLNGSLLEQAKLQGSDLFQLDIPHLRTGMYFYQIQLDDKTIKRAKLVVTK